MPGKWRRIDIPDDIENFILTKNSKTTQYAYKSAFRDFIEFLDSQGVYDSIEAWIQAIFDDLEQPLRRRKRVAEMTLNAFVKFLKKNGRSANTILTYTAPLRNYLRFRNIKLDTSFVNLPKPVAKEENTKHKWTIEEVKRFLNSATNYRDKALIACMFQSGLAVNEICSLNYGDVRRELEKGVLPLMLNLTREKTQTRFVTFFGRDSVRYLKLYLQTRTNLEDDSPLFTLLGTEDRLTHGAVQARFRELGRKVDYFGDDNGNGFNPLRPHSLRTAFNTFLINRVADTLRNFWMGHSIGGQEKTYMNMPDAEMRQLYADAEKYLCLEKTSLEELAGQQTSELKVEELSRRVEELEKENRTLLTDMIKINEALEVLAKYFSVEPLDLAQKEFLSHVVKIKKREIEKEK